MKRIITTIFALVSTAAFGMNTTSEAGSGFSEIEKLGFPISKTIKIDEKGFDGMYFIRVGKDWVMASKESSLVFKGDVIDLAKREIVTSRFLAPVNKEILKTFPESMKVVYEADGKTVGVINVLTDTSCPFCTKLHKEVPALNKAGIEVRYIPFARGYTNGAGYKQMLSVWCADDKNKALDDMFSGGNSKDPSRCLTQALKKGYELSSELGATGTPAIYFSNGEENSGYAPAKVLIQKNKDIAN